MPRPRKGARLYPYSRKGRPAVYIIRDGTHRESTGCGLDDFEGADRKFKDYCKRTFRPDTGQRDLAKIKVAEVLAMYGRDLPHDSPSRALVGYHIANLLRFWGDKTLAEVKGSTCRGYTKSRTDEGSGAISVTRKRSVKSSTVRRELKTLQAAINHWHKESPLEAIPQVTLPDESPRRERVLERSEAAALLRAARRLGAKHVARFILIGIYTGTRHGAVLQLRWSAALAGGHIDIERGIIYRRGSAEKETSKRRPPLRYPKRLGTFLGRWRERDRSSSITRVIHYRGQPILRMQKAWRAVVKEAGLGKDVTPHVLRHTCASWALWSGMSIWDVAGLIGADASTVERVYGHHRLAADTRQVAVN